jgi:glycosyltransferase involved in cell wall biosynthesis
MHSKNRAKRKIVYVVGSLANGGIERSVTEWALHLKANTDWEPLIICILERKGNFLDILTKNGIDVYECKLRNNGITPFTFRMARLLKQTQAKVVHSQVSFSLLWQTLSYRLGGCNKIIFTQQNEYKNWNNFLRKSRLKTYYHLSRNFINYYTCVSSKVRENISDLLDVSRERFIVIYNSVNTNLFYPRPHFRKIARERLGLADTVFTIGMVASFSEQKGHKYLFEACVLLKEKGLDFRLVLIGSGDPSLHRQLVKTLNLENQVLFLGNRSDVPELLHAFDCFVLPSLWEGLPLALLEAMASEIPVIGSNTSGISEIISHKNNGLLVESKNCKELSLAILEINANPALAKSLAKSGKDHVTKKFGLQESISQYLRLYEY